MLRFKISRQQMPDANIFGFFNHFFRLVQIKCNLQTVYSFYRVTEQIFDVK